MLSAAAEPDGLLPWAACGQAALSRQEGGCGRRRRALVLAAGVPRGSSCRRSSGVLYGQERRASRLNQSRRWTALRSPTGWGPGCPRRSQPVFLPPEELRNSPRLPSWCSTGPDPWETRRSLLPHTGTARSAWPLTPLSNSRQQGRGYDLAFPFAAHHLLREIPHSRPGTKTAEVYRCHAVPRNMRPRKTVRIFQIKVSEY